MVNSQQPIVLRLWLWNKSSVLAQLQLEAGNHLDSPSSYLLLIKTSMQWDQLQLLKWSQDSKNSRHKELFGGTGKIQAFLILVNNSLIEAGNIAGFRRVYLQKHSNSLTVQNYMK